MGDVALVADASSSETTTEQVFQTSRKPQPLKTYSARLRTDQIAFLKGIQNASEWLRKVIDEARAKDPFTSSGNRVILLTRQLRDIEQQITTINENPMYTDAKNELARIQKEKNPLDNAIQFYQKLVSGAYDHLLETRLQRLPSVYEHLDYLDPPDNEVMALWWPVKNLYKILNERRSILFLGDVPSHIIDSARSNTSKVLPELVKEQETLGQAEAKQKTIMAGFEAEIRTLVEKRLKGEQDLLEAGHVMEAAESQGEMSGPRTETS